MRPILLAGLVMVLLAGTTPPAGAQARGRPSGGASIVGTIRDADGEPVSRAHVCVELPGSPRLTWMHCARADSSAAFRLDGLPAGTWLVTVSCEAVGLLGKQLASEDVGVSEGVPTMRDWAVDASGCDPRPLRRVAGVFRGHYTPGFEASEFVPCAEDAWFLPSDLLRTQPYDERRAWAVLSDARFPDAFSLPEAPRDSYGNPRYYVHWRGTVVGPGRYGHFGVSAFELRVDSVLELRAPREGDCAPIQGPHRDLQSRVVPLRAPRTSSSSRAMRRAG
jgi:hypothetical protein